LLNNLWQQHQSTLHTERLIQNIEADVVVVGAGFSGLSSAYHLALQGKRVVVLEAQTIGYGASGRNVGLTNAGLWIMPKDTERLLGRKEGQALNQLLIDAPLYVKQLINEHNLDCDFVDNGTLHLAHSRSAIKYLQERKQQLSAYGAKIEFLDQQTTFAKSRAQGYYGSLLDTQAGTVQPLKYCYSLAKLATQQQVEIYTHSCVQQIEKQGCAFLLNTEKGQVRAAKVILATNAYEQKLTLNTPLYTPLYFCQLASEPMSEQQRRACLPDNNGCWDSGAVMRSFRTDSDGRLIVGTVGDIHTQDASGFKRWSKHVVSNTFKDIGELTYQYAWSGRIAKSHNNIPQVLETQEGIIQVMGYSGRGIAGATVVGRELANYLTGQSDKTLALPINKAKNISFNQVRAAVYEIGSQLSHLSDHIIR
jgi:glycine/D-amino acid oxidase-like deaminating enzyme